MRGFFQLPDIAGEILRFAFVGGLATAIHGAVYLTLVSLPDAWPQIANLLAFLCAFAVSLLGHSYFTFPDQNGMRRLLDSARRLTVISLAGLGLNAGFVFLVTHILQADERYALIFIVFATPLLTFVGSKFWAFRTDL